MKTGRLKILPGPAALLKLIAFSSDTYNVSVDDVDGQISWSQSMDSADSETEIEIEIESTIQGRLVSQQIKSVAQYGACFVLDLHKGSYSVPAMVFEAESEDEAHLWVAQVSKILGKPEDPGPVVVPVVNVMEDQLELLNKISLRLADPQKLMEDADTPVAELQYDLQKLIELLESTKPVKITYQVDSGDSIEEEFELLVVACDPNNIKGVLNFSKEETAIFDKLINFTFHTTLLKVKVPKNPGPHGVIFAPDSLELMDGSPYGFRNESAKQFDLKAAADMEFNLVTVYQLRGTKPPTWDNAKFLSELKKQLKANPVWWPYGKDYEILESMTTPYFNHFKEADLVKGLPWEMLNLQGHNHTLYVHAFTCFESVLHCWGYADLMLRSMASARDALPKLADAPIAILGAGPSGLLFATRLKRLGYTNIKLLESTDRFGGKTRTIKKPGFSPIGKPLEDTVCELGTCYLSPAYEPMVDDLQNYLAGNQQYDFAAANPGFRGIVADLDDYSPGTIFEYGEYIVLVAIEQLPPPKGFFDKWRAITDLLLDVSKYVLIHDHYVGHNPPMPVTKPSKLNGKFGKQTFLEFLKDHNLLSMVGILEYGYEVQGYGRVSQIPAYYGLLWITPAIFWAMLLDTLGLKKTPIVSAWTRGWQDVWDQMASKESLNITCGATVTKIVRS